MKNIFFIFYKTIAIQLSICFLLSKSANAIIPTPNKVVVVILENHSYNQIVGSSAAPYINSLINDSKGALFTQSYGLINSSQPNYLQLFSGSNQGILNNNLPSGLPFTTPNLGASLIAASKTFIGYAESLPSVGYNGVSSPPYDRKHNPWVNWQGAATNGIASTLNQPFTAFPTNYNLLSSVSFVVPNELNNMHDGSISDGDTWLQTNLDSYIQWAKSNNSLLILTFDEDDYKSQLQVLTLFIGQKVTHGSYPNVINHYNILRTIEDMFSLPHAGAASTAATIDYCWNVCNQPALIAANGPLTFCQGNSVTLTASNGVSYLWSNGATTSSIVASTQNNYTVAITDALNCTTTSAPTEVALKSFSYPLQIFTETVGAVSSNTPISTYETNNGFDSDVINFSGNGDVSATSTSSGYSGASGGGNIFLNNVTGQNVVISNINTNGFSNLQLSFGIYKNTVSTTSADLIVQVSIDGITYTPLSYVTLPIGVALWNYRTATGTIPSTANLRIQFLQTNSVTQFRIDDINLKYAITSPSISASGSTSFCPGNTVTLNASIANSYNWSNGPTTQNITVGTTGNYFVTETSSNGCSAVSNTITVNAGPSVTPAVAISANTGATVCNGTNVTFTAVPTNGGSSPSYQWKKNGTNTGTNSSTYSDNGLATGNQITCVMTSNANCLTGNPATSNLVTMNVNPLPIISNFSPSSGLPGSTVIINGSGFVNTPLVKFNGVAASIVVNSSTQISSTVPAGNSSGNIAVSNSCGTATSATIFTNTAPHVTLNLKLFIEGFYSGGGFMHNNANGGCLYINSISNNPLDVDTVFISAMNATSHLEVNKQFGILKTNGNVSVTFNGSVIAGNSYFIKVQHRNTLETWSAAAINMATTTSYDFTTAKAKAYGNNQSLTSDPNVWAFYSGDISHFQTGVGHQDGIIEDRDYGDLENALYYTLIGYLVEDITGDGIVESADYGIMENNVYLTILVSHP